MGGLAPLSYAELKAWQDQCGHRLRPWEVTLIRGMSQAYADQLSRSDDPKEPPPWADELTPEQRAKVANHIRSVLRD